MKRLNPQPQIIPTYQEVFTNPQFDVKKYLKKVKRPTVEIVFFGSNPWSIHVLKALEDNFDVKAIVTAHNSPVLNYFQGPILTPDKLDENFLTSHLSFLTSDLFIVASYGKIIPQILLDIPKYGALNIHPSLLPKYRGASPVPAAILNGDKETGVTIIKMDQKMDHGPILFTKEISLSGQEDFTILINKLFRLGAEVLVKIIPDFIAEKLPLKPQNYDKATFTKLLTREDGYIDLASPPDSVKLDRMIRAYSPWPGVWTRWNGKIVKFLPNVTLNNATVTLSETKSIYSSPPEAAQSDKSTPQNDKFLIQMEGKKAIPIKDFLNGYPDFPLNSFDI